MPSEARQSPQCRLKPRHSPCCPQLFVIPATFRHSRENGNLEPQTFR
ncbi:hypothetical protein [Neisseria basseii]|nr:hypothetical protein [Neisseria basseii]